MLLIFKTLCLFCYHLSLRPIGVFSLVQAYQSIHGHIWRELVVLDCYVLRTPRDLQIRLDHILMYARSAYQGASFVLSPSDDSVCSPRRCLRQLFISQAVFFFICVSFCTHLLPTSTLFSMSIYAWGSTQFRLLFHGWLFIFTGLSVLSLHNGIIRFCPQNCQGSKLLLSGSFQVRDRHRRPYLLTQCLVTFPLACSVHF